MSDGIGLAQKEPPAQGGGVLSGLGNAGFVLEAFGAGVRGQEPLFRKFLQDKKEEDSAKEKAFSQSLIDAQNGIELIQGLDEGPEKNKAVEDLVSNFDPDFQSIVRSAAKNPAEVFSIAESLDSSMMKDIVKMDPSGKLAIEILGTESGRKLLITDPANRKFFNPASQKVRKIIDFLEVNSPDLLERARANDGEISNSELSVILDEANKIVPNEIALSAREKGVFLDESNQNILKEDFGIKIVGVDEKPDITDLQKSQNERNLLEQQLVSETDPVERQKLQRDLDEKNAGIGRATTIVGRTKEDVGLTTSQIGKDIKQRDQLVNAIQDVVDIRKKIQADPSLAGPVGSIRKAGQTITGVVSDISSIFGGGAGKALVDAALEIVNEGIENGDIDESVKGEFLSDPTLSELRLFENGMGLILARLRTEEGRLLKSVIKKSIDDAKITGLTSSKDVINRMKEIERQLVRRVDDINTRLGDRKASDMTTEEILEAYKNGNP